MNLYRLSHSVSSTAAGRAETEEDYQIPSSTLCLRQAAVCISVPQRCSVCPGSQAHHCESSILRSCSGSKITALLPRYVENSSSPPSVEDKQPQVLELGESSNMPDVVPDHPRSMCSGNNGICYWQWLILDINGPCFCVDVRTLALVYLIIKVPSTRCLSYVHIKHADAEKFN